jgi:membrane associated rhomboid family serine protease
MGIEGRDWMLEGRPLAAEPSRTAGLVTLTLLGVWIVYLAVTPGTRTAPSGMGRFISQDLLLRPAQVLEGAWWQPFTAPLFHSVRGFFHPFAILLLLYLLGRWIESRGGARSYWMVLLCGWFVWTVGLLCFARDTRLVGLGMEGPVFAMLGWIWVRALPSDHVSVAGSMPRLGPLAVVLLVVLGLLLGVANPGGSASTPFPFLCAYLLSFGAGQMLGRRGGARAAKQRSKEKEKAHPLEIDVVDRLLDKVSREGLASLTDAERAALERASRDRR